MGGKEFEYLIADDYKEGTEVPDGFITKTIPAFTWAVFPCRGSMPNAMQEVCRKIFSEWLPNCKEYEVPLTIQVPSQYQVVDEITVKLQLVKTAAEKSDG